MGESISLQLSEEDIRGKIYHLRGKSILLDQDLAFLYQTETKNLKRQVRRNIERFPEDFMFELTREEFDDLRCQLGTSSWGGTRYLPMAFTEQGVAMLSSVLKSPRAIEVNIEIMRTFVRLRRALNLNEELRMKLKEIEKRVGSHDSQIYELYITLKKFLGKEPGKRNRIGFNSE